MKKLIANCHCDKKVKGMLIGGSSSESFFVKAHRVQNVGWIECRNSRQREAA
jgi:hypothetical protein